MKYSENQRRISIFVVSVRLGKAGSELRFTSKQDLSVAIMLLR
ncbi:hypothetical protein [Desulfocicer vacuolatum]|nr:hypothetical protein [Desulfocicer vacuolatum]